MEWAYHLCCWLSLCVPESILFSMYCWFQSANDNGDLCQTGPYSCRAAATTSGSPKIRWGFLSLKERNALHY